MYPEDQKTLTIARRTRKNLDFIYEQKSKGADVEEFTHLLNSMLGMVICIREEYFKNTRVTWQDVKRRGLPVIDVAAKAPNDKSPQLHSHKTFNELISNLRHAFVHNCFELIADSQGKLINGITVWNISPPPRTPNVPANRNWEADITEQQLKALAYLFIEYVEKNLASSSTV